MERSNHKHQEHDGHVTTGGAEVGGTISGGDPPPVFMRVQLSMI